MAFSTKFNPWTKTLQWISETTSMAWSSITGIPVAISGTQEAFTTALKSKLDGIVDPLMYKGVINCSTNPNFPAAEVGHLYKVSVAGKIGGASGVNVEIGDALICNTNTVAGDYATVGVNWNILQSNVDGAVIGPASATDNNVVEFNGTTGKLVKDGLLSHTDVSDAVSKKHTQGTDQGLDTGGANAVTAAAIKTAITTILSSKLANVSEDTTPQLGGELDCGSHSIIYTGQLITSTAGVAAIDWRNGNKAKLTLSENVTTFNWTAPSGKCSLLLEIKQDATPRTIAWPEAVLPSGFSPVISTPNETYLIGIYYNGTNYFCSSDINTSTVGTLINGATEKTTPVDADMVGLMDSQATNILKKLSWTNIKATLKTYFDTVYTLAALGGIASSYLDTDGTLAANSDTKIATQKATKTYANTRPPLKIGSFTRDVAAATGDVAYTGVGFEPRLIIFFAGMGTTNIGSYGVGIVGTQFCMRHTNATTISYSTGGCIHLALGASDEHTAIVKSVESNGFTLTWTKVGTSVTGTCSAFYIAIG